ATAKAGLIHVSVNFTLEGEELAYILNQSGSRALFHDPDLEEKVEAVKDRCDLEIFGTFRDGRAFDVLKRSGEGVAQPPEVEIRDSDLAQLLYTSGTISAPNVAMMTYRALMHEYICYNISFASSPEYISLL